VVSPLVHPQDCELWRQVELADLAAMGVEAVAPVGSSHQCSIAWPSLWSCSA
jgi:hypothetical protein